MRDLGGENISHCGNGFSQISDRGMVRVGHEGTGELQTKKVIIIQVTNPDCFGPDYARCGGQTAGRTDGCAGDFEGNHGGFGQGTTDNDQSSAGRNVDCRGEFQGFLAIFVAGAHENRNGELQSGPFTSVLGQKTVLHVTYTCQKRL
jgi:hypothetical protein